MEEGFPESHPDAAEAAGKFCGKFAEALIFVIVKNVNLMRAIEFGVHEEVSVHTGASQTNNWIPINRLEYVITSKSGMFVCEDGRTKKTIPVRLRASVLIEEYSLIAGISEVGSELAIFYTGAMDRPLISGFKTDLVAVFHLMYSPVSHSLIAVGSGVYVWYLKVEKQRNVVEVDASMVRVIPRGNICRDFETSLLNPPCFDYQSEILYVPTKQGFVGYDLDGNEVQMMSKKATTPLSACALAPVTKKLLTSDVDGFCLWKRGPILEKRIQGVASAVILVRFVDRNFAIFMDVNLLVYVLDIRIGKFWHVLSFPRKPNGLFVVDEKGEKNMYVFQGPTVTRYRIVIPWDLWLGQTTEVVCIRRCPRLNEAARIAFLSQNKMVTLCSPKKGAVLTTASSARPANPCNFCYDRGLWYENGVYSDISLDRRDLLFVTMGDSKTPVFTTGDNPCVEERFIDLNVTAMLPCKLCGQATYCFATKLGELQFYDYATLKPVRRFMLTKGKILNLYYHEKNNSIICVYTDQLAMFSLSQQKVIGKILPIDDGRVSGMKDDYIFLGYQNGSMEMFRIDEKEIVPMADAKPHEKAITGFAFGIDFYVTVSLDQTVKLWEYDMSPISEIRLPFSLRAVEVLNGNRDLVVGTDNEILKIPGRQIFGNVVDPRVEAIDNFDELDDELAARMPVLSESTDQQEVSSPTEAATNASPRGKRQRRGALRAKIANSLRSRPSNQSASPGPRAGDEMENDEESRKRKIAEMNGLMEKRDEVAAATSGKPTESTEDQEVNGTDKAGDGNECDDDAKDAIDDDESNPESEGQSNQNKKKHKKRKGTVKSTSRDSDTNGRDENQADGASRKRKSSQAADSASTRKDKGKRQGQGARDVEQSDDGKEQKGTTDVQSQRRKAGVNSSEESENDGDEYGSETDETGVKKGKRKQGEGRMGAHNGDESVDDRQASSREDNGSVLVKERSNKGKSGTAKGTENDTSDDEVSDSDSPGERRHKKRKGLGGGRSHDTKQKKHGHDSDDESEDTSDGDTSYGSEDQNTKHKKHGQSMSDDNSSDGLKAKNASMSNKGGTSAKKGGKRANKNGGSADNSDTSDEELSKRQHGKNSIEKSFAFRKDDESGDGNETKSASNKQKDTKSKAKKKNKKKGKRAKMHRTDTNEDLGGNSKLGTDHLSTTAPVPNSATSQVDTLNIKQRPYTPLAYQAQKPAWMERAAQRSKRRPGTPTSVPTPLFTLPTPEIVLDKVACINKIIDGEIRLLPLLKRFGNEQQLRALYKKAFEVRELESQFHKRRLLTQETGEPATIVHTSAYPASPSGDIQRSADALIILASEKEPVQPNPTTQSVIIHLSVSEPEASPRMTARRKINYLARLASLGEDDLSEPLDELIVTKNIQVKRQMALNSQDVVPTPRKTFKLGDLKQPEPIQRLRTGIDAMTRTVPIHQPSPRRTRRVQPLRRTMDAVVLSDIIRGVKCRHASP